MVRIAAIQAGSIAEELQIEIGSRVVRVNGERVRDGIDLTFMLSESVLTLETVSPSGQTTITDIQRDEGEPVGIVPAPDTVRECANKCVFCFIDGNPRDVRGSLWIRDDDFRLSFTYGSYVTLTNLGPKGLQRLADQKISPLYVSVHATDPELRVRLLKNDRAGMIVDQLRYLLDAGLEVHTQAVLCPEWNDGAQLDRTMTELFELGEGIRTLSIVPVGLTKYNVNRPVRPMTPQEARSAVAQVDIFRTRAIQERGCGWVYAADEMYLAGGLELPEGAYYDAWDLTENGVGAVRGFLKGFHEGIGEVPRLGGRRLRILTGSSMAPFMEGLAPTLSRATGAPVQVHVAENRFYGELVTVAGLLAGEDLLAALEGPTPDDIILLPAEALNADGLFIDSYSLDAFREAVSPATLVTGYEITEALRTL